MECRKSYPGDDDSSNADADAGALEQFVPQVDAVPEGHEVPLDLDVVASVQSAIDKDHYTSLLTLTRELPGQTFTVARGGPFARYVPVAVVVHDDQDLGVDDVGRLALNYRPTQSGAPGRDGVRLHERCGGQTSGGFKHTRTQIWRRLLHRRIDSVTLMLSLPGRPDVDLSRGGRLNGLADVPEHPA